MSGRNSVNGTVDQAALWGAAVLLVVAVVVGVVDLVATFSGGRVQTVSEVIYSWSRQWPILPFALGALVGHLLWPTRPPVVIPVRQVLPSPSADRAVLGRATGETEGPPPPPPE